MFSNTKKLTPKIDVVIPKRVADQIKHLCKVIPHVEWSGPLFYTIEGSIQDPRNCKITLEDILPLDKGSAGFTTYEIGLPVAKFMHKNNAPEKGWKLGHIHSHNNMGVFFSGTDESELKSNAENHNFYLSVIVNNKHEIIAKVGTVAELNREESTDEKIGYQALDEDGNPYLIEELPSSAKNKFFEFECNIIEEEAPIEVSEEFLGLISKMTEHRLSSREFPSKGNSYEEKTSNQIGFRKNSQASREDKFTSKYSINSAPKMDHNISELAFELIANGDIQAMRLSGVDDIVDYYIAIDEDPDTLSTDIIDRYEEVYDKIFSETGSYIPRMYVLRNVIKTYKDVTDPATPSINNFMLPTIKKLEAKYSKEIQ